MQDRSVFKHKMAKEVLIVHAQRSKPIIMTKKYFSAGVTLGKELFWNRVYI